MRRILVVVAMSMDTESTFVCDLRSLAYHEASLFKKAADDASRCMRYNPYDVVGKKYNETVGVKR